MDQTKKNQSPRAFARFAPHREPGGATCAAEATKALFQADADVAREGGVGEKWAQGVRGATAAPLRLLRLREDKNLDLQKEPHA